jgi:hypothetical protein
MTIDIHESPRRRKSPVVARFGGSLVDPAEYRCGHDENGEAEQGPSESVPFC